MVAAPDRAQRESFAVLGLWFSGVLALVGWSIVLADGHLVYALDDPYIHLAVAESILQGGYGVNMGEYAAPSSSIVYPLLLALTEWVGLGAWGPLVINVLAMAAVVFLVGRVVSRCLRSDGCGQARLFPLAGVLPAATGLLVCMALNAWGLIMTGMEHSLHVLAVMTVFLGFLKVIEEDSQAPCFLVASIIALPLIRFEGIAMALFALLALIYLRRWLAALAVTSLLVLVLCAWLGFTQALGLPVLPSSVLLKSGVAASMDGHAGVSQLLASVLDNLGASVSRREGALLLAAAVVVGALGCHAWQRGYQRMAVVIGGLAVLTGLSHVCFGRYGWFSRYEIYAYTAVIIPGFLLVRVSSVHAVVAGASLIGLLPVAWPYAATTWMTPLASRNIYQQQYQMHRFVADYWKRPVAVNDLGLVSYHNPGFVLDLWGLGSEEIRRMKLAGTLDARAIDALLSRRQVSLMMAYEDWFAGLIPAGWQKVAVLETSRITAASGKVAFYVGEDVDRAAMRALLHAFGQTLPAGAVLHLSPS